MRDTLADKAYWDDFLAFMFEDSLPGLAEVYPSPGTGTATRVQQASFYLSELFCAALALYSAGKPVVEVVVMARQSVIVILPKYLADFPPETDGGAAPFHISNIHRFLAMLALCRPTREEATEVFAAFDCFGENLTFHGSEDRVFTIYRNRLLGEDAPLPGTVLWPEAYGSLARAMDPELPDNVRPQYLGEFLQGWYKKMSSEVAAQTTWGDNLGPESEYVGYWCLEAAGAAVLLGIDDSTFADHPYYPKDWADWARHD